MKKTRGVVSDDVVPCLCGKTPISCFTEIGCQIYCANIDCSVAPVVVAKNLGRAMEKWNECQKKFNIHFNNPS